MSLVYLNGKSIFNLVFQIREGIQILINSASPANSFQIIMSSLFVINDSKEFKIKRTYMELYRIYLSQDGSY
jgi:hypothetical protein